MTIFLGKQNNLFMWYVITVFLTELLSLHSSDCTFTLVVMYETKITHCVFFPLFRFRLHRPVLNSEQCSAVICHFLKVDIHILRRPQNFSKSPPYFWLALHRTKVGWRFCKILWHSHNIRTLSCKRWLFFRNYLSFLQTYDFLIYFPELKD